jgi:hypothetical protein
MASAEFSNQIDFKPALKRPEQKVDPDSSGDEEDDLGKRHTNE